MKATLALNDAAPAQSHEQSAAGETGRTIDLVGHVEVSLAAQVGTITLSVERLFGLKTGDVVSMNEQLEAPLTLMLNGRPVARAELLAVDDHFGVRILELA